MEAGLNMETGKILNLTRDNASIYQKDSGVIDLPPALKKRIAKLLTFEDKKSLSEIRDRAEDVNDIIIEYLWLSAGAEDEEITTALEEKNIRAVLIDGAPWLMSSMEYELSNYTQVLYSFTKREVVERTIDGKTVKTIVFNHNCFVEAII